MVWGQRAQEDVGDLLHQTGYSRRCLHLSGFWQPLKLCDTYLTSCQLRPGGNLCSEPVAERFEEIKPPISETSLTGFCNYMRMRRRGCPISDINYLNQHY